MIVKFFAHLPGVLLSDSEEAIIGPGKLIALPFDAWTMLDPSFKWNERQYGESKPVFYSEVVNYQEDQSPNFEPDEGYINLIINDVKGLVSHFHLALLLAPFSPILPLPHLSAMYLVFEGKIEEVVRVIGSMEREWIIFGSKIRYSFTNDDIAAIQRAYIILEDLDLDKTFSGVEAGLDALIMTTFPEVWWDNFELNQIYDFVHCMTALENLLLPPRDQAPKAMKLTPTFGKHAAVIMGTSPHDLSHQSEQYAKLYRLRSKLIHGEIGILDLQAQEWEQLKLGRFLLRTVILRAILLQQFLTEESSLSALLEQALHDADFHQQLLHLLDSRQL